MLNLLDTDENKANFATNPVVEAFQVYEGKQKVLVIWMDLKKEE